MKEKFASLLLIFVLIFSARGVCAEGITLKHEPLSAKWRQANELYAAKDYAKAVQGYEEIASEYKLKDPSLFYNLGNAYFKSGKLGLAILNYKKSLLADPRRRATRENLDFAKAQIPLQIDSAAPAFLKWLLKQSRFVRKGEAVNLTLLFFILFLLLTVLRLTKEMRWIYPARRVVLALLLLSLVLTGLKFYDERDRDAILISPQVTVRFGPSRQEEVEFKLAEGIHVKVADSIGDWYRINLANGKTGWVEKTDLGFIDS